MNEICSFVMHLSSVIGQRLVATLEVCHKVACMYKEELSTFPFSIDILNVALHSKKLRETAHCRILYKILQNEELQDDFVRHFLPGVDYLVGSIQILPPDTHRMDLAIKGNNFFLIIENKVNEACEQPGQIDRYVRIAQQTYPDEQIYVLYLGGEANVFPSENSLSSDVRRILDERIICKNYKDDIISWISSVYEGMAFNEQPLLKGALLSYRTYLENKYNLSNQYKVMNNKLDSALIEALALDSIPLDEKMSVIQDEIGNIDKIRERLSCMLQDYRDQYDMQNIRSWYDECTNILSGRPILTMENRMEFGFNFRYRNTDFRCCVSFDDREEPYWGIRGLVENKDSRPKVFGTLHKMVIRSNKGFHDYGYNAKEWVVSDYERREFIVDRFIALARLICASESCSIME